MEKVDDVGIIIVSRYPSQCSGELMDSWEFDVLFKRVDGVSLAADIKLLFPTPGRLNCCLLTFASLTIGCSVCVVLPPR